MSSVPVEVRGPVKRYGENRLVDGGKVLVGGATVTKADVTASNGVIHVINKVLIP